MHRLTSNLFKFYTRETIQQTKYFQNIPKLKYHIKCQPFFAKERQRQIGRQIERCIQAKRWKTLLEGLQCISIGNFDSRVTSRKIGMAFTTLLQKIQIKTMQRSEVQMMLRCMERLNYQPIPKRTQSSNSQYLYDDIENFTRQLTNYVNQLVRQKNLEQSIRIMRYLLHTNPQLFKQMQKEIENFLLKKLYAYTEYSRKFYLTALITKGVISNYWSAQFRDQLIKQAKNKRMLQWIQPLQLDDLTFPNQVTPSQIFHNDPLRGEEKVLNIMKGFGYKVKANVNINKYEVDFLINDFFVLQYNGNLHFATNCKNQVLKLQHQWKSQALKKRGFLVSEISCEQWKRIHYFEDRRIFLVKKIENSLLKHYFPE